MKTILKKRTVRALLMLTGLFYSVSLCAQDTEGTPLSGDYSFLAVKNLAFVTTSVIGDDEIKAWTGDGYHAGYQSFSLTLYNCDDIPSSMVVPDNPYVFCEIQDMDGNTVTYQEDSLTYVFRRLQYVKSYSATLNLSESVLRGGTYQLKAGISPDLFSYEEKEIVLTEEAGIYVNNRTTKVDYPLSLLLAITGAYPYNPAETTGEKSLHWQLVSANTPTEVIDEGDGSFELKSETTTLAAVDTLIVTVEEDLAPGEYIFTITSDYEPINNRSFTAVVNDVLKPEITLDKSLYAVGDTEAVITVNMSYGYPYVGEGSSSTPTVQVSAGLLGEETSCEYSDEAWANSDMQCTAELKVPLSGVTADVVTENNGEIPVTLAIKFNGVSQYQSSVILPYDVSAGIENMQVDESGKSNVKYYNVLGVEVDDSYRGLVVCSDGKKIIR